MSNAIKFTETGFIEYGACFKEKETLEKAGYEVALAGDGRDAVSLIKSDPEIGLILMDVYMPKLNGIESTRVIRELKSENDRGRVPILALTATSSDEEKDMMLEAGCDTVLTKPIKGDELPEAIGRFGT